MKIEKEDPKELLAEARAIHFAMRNGAITYQQAKERTKPILQRLNAILAKIAKKHNRKPMVVRFHDLGTTL